jgi:hypothetical protein
MSQQVKFQLRKFDMRQIKDDRTVVLIGKRDTGKSFLTRDILYYHSDIPIGTVISPTNSANRFYSQIVPSMFIYDEYNPEIISRVMKRQTKMIKRINRGEGDLDPRMYVIMDDCLYDNSWQKDKNIRSIFMNGRHYKILFLLTMQYAMGIPPNLRTNIDYIFILRENILKNRQRIYEQYAGMFPTFEMFCATMDQCTENFECLVIHNGSKSNKIEDQVFWYKADDHPNFRMGSEKIWDFCRQNYPEDDDDDDDDGPDDYRMNGNNMLPARKRNAIEYRVKKV